MEMEIIIQSKPMKHNRTNSYNALNERLNRVPALIQSDGLGYGHCKVRAYY